MGTMSIYHIKSKKSTISGSLSFRYKNVSIPISNIECAIRIKKKKFNLMCFYTRKDGNFTVDVPLHEAEDLVLEVYSVMKGDYSITVEKQLKKYCLICPHIHVRYGKNYSGWDIVVSENRDSDFYRSLCIITAYRLGFEYVNKFCKMDKSLIVRYPMKKLSEDDDTCCWKKWIRIDKDVALDFAVLMHEFGHFVSYALGFNNSLVGYSHTNETNIAAEKKIKIRGLHFAWNEGFATFFAGLAFNRIAEFDKYFNIPRLYYENRKYKATGESNEWSVFLFLAYATYKMLPRESFTFSLEHLLTDKELWNMLSSKKPKTIAQFLKTPTLKSKDISLLSNCLSLAKIAPYDLKSDLPKRNLSLESIIDYSSSNKITKLNIEFTNAGVQSSKQSRLDKFYINTKIQGETSYSRICVKLDQLKKVGTDNYSYEIKSTKIIDALNERKKVEVYIEGWQTYGVDTGPYPSKSISLVLPPQRKPLPITEVSQYEFPMIDAIKGGAFGVIECEKTKISSKK